MKVKPKQQVLTNIVLLVLKCLFQVKNLFSSINVDHKVIELDQLGKSVFYLRSICEGGDQTIQGPVVQNFVCLTSSLRQLVK